MAAIHRPQVTLEPVKPSIPYDMECYFIQATFRFDQVLIRFSRNDDSPAT
jgi:hypothetical protein